MKYWILFLTLILFLQLVQADSTFFDNQDDVFIMSNSATGGVIEEITEATTDGGSCLTNWTCSDWSSCNNKVQIRNCTKEKAYCYADLNKKPIENQNCSTDKSGDKNNTGSGEEINNYQNENNGNFNNINLFSLKIIIVLILIVIGFIILYKRYRKRRYFHYGY